MCVNFLTVDTSDKYDINGDSVGNILTIYEGCVDDAFVAVSYCFLFFIILFLLDFSYIPFSVSRGFLYIFCNFGKNLKINAFYCYYKNYVLHFSLTRVKAAVLQNHPWLYRYRVIENELSYIKVKSIHLTSQSFHI